MRYKWVYILVFIYLALSPAFIAAQSIADYRNRSQSSLDSGDYVKAISILEKAISEYSKSGSQDSLAYLYLQLGNSYKVNDQYYEAFNAYQIAEKKFKLNTNYEGLGRLYVSFIEYYRARGNYSSAINYIKTMDDLLLKHKVSDRLKGRFFSRVASVEMELGSNIEKSRKYSIKVIEIAQDLGDLDLEGMANNDVAFTYENSGEMSTALDYYKRALMVWKEDSNYRSLANVYINLGRISRRLDHFKEAFDYYQKGISIAEEYEFDDAKVMLYYGLHKCYLHNKDYEQAYNYFYICHNLQNELKEKQNKKVLLELERKYDLEKQKNINEAAKKRAAIAELDARNKGDQLYFWIKIFLVLAVLLIVITFLVVRLKRSNFMLKTTNEKLENTVEQKDAIFRELHHRVKNNLTMLKSILFLHAKSSNNEDVKHVLNDCQHRIDSMSTVHQNLYEVDNSTRVELNTFLNQLIKNLKESILPEKKEFSTYIEENTVSLNISTAVFIGIIINELVTNSMKYATKEGEELFIGIALNQDEEDHLHIRYWDNGIGLPANSEIGEADGFGFKLINIMMRQLKTSLNYSVIEGLPTFSFTLNNKSI